MIYLVISIGIILIVFSYFQEKKSKTLFREIYEEEKVKPPIRLVNNTYEEIEYHNELAEMKEQIAILQNNNTENKAKQENIAKRIDYVDEPLMEHLEDSHSEPEESFLDALANEAGVRKGDLLSLKKP